MDQLYSSRSERFYVTHKFNLDVPGSAIDCQQEMGNRLHWPVQPILPIIPFPVVILWPNRVHR